ncbi:MAG: sigma-54 dependent transcriptional regulator [Candidatus Coatesbacteria bacterium]
MAKHLLVIDDDPAVRRSLAAALEGDGLRVTLAATAAEGQALYLRETPDVVVLDLFLPDRHGLEVLKTLRAGDPEAAVIVVTASDDVRDGVEAMKLGALEYLVKPYDLDALRVLIGRTVSRQREVQELGAHRRQQSQRYTFEALASENPACAAMVATARKLATSPTVTLLLEGETGVGKEFMARAVHHASPRAAGPFTAISCAAIPETLLESELFGHEAGAFTDARSRKRGLFELAEGGTLLLDEVAEMVPATQAKFLRVIEARSFRRVGGTEDLTVDTRIIAATNAVLERAVEAKRFREDLYYRLKVGHLVIPPLRDRPEDLLPLAGRLLADICRELRRPVPALSPAVQEAFRAYHWPGNVRELRNVLERAVILHEGTGSIEPAHLPPLSGPATAGSATLTDIEREHILRVLEHHGGNQTKAAKALGISRNTLWEKLKQYRSGGNR